MKLLSPTERRRVYNTRHSGAERIGGRSYRTLYLQRCVRGPIYVGLNYESAVYGTRDGYYALSAAIN